MQERSETTQKDRDWKGKPPRPKWELKSKSSVFAFEMVFLPQVAQDRRRLMRRITYDGR